MQRKSLLIIAVYTIIVGNVIGICSPASHKHKGTDTSGGGGTMESSGWVRKGSAVLYKDGASNPTSDVGIQAKCWSVMVASQVSAPEYVATSLSDHLLDQALNTPNYPTPINHHASTDERHAGVQNFGVRFSPTLSKGTAAINRVRFNYHYKPFAVASVGVTLPDALSGKTVYAIATGNLAYQAASGAHSDVLSDTTFRAYQATSASSFSLSSPSVSFGNISLGGLSYTPNSFGNASDRYTPSDTSSPIQREGHDTVGPTAHVELLVPIAGRVYTAICNTTTSSAKAEADLAWGLSPGQFPQHDQWQNGPYRSGDAFVFDNP